MNIVLLIVLLIPIVQAFDWSVVQQNYLNVPGFFRSNSKSERIVGGYEVEPHQFPWQVGLRLLKKSGEVTFCGGSLISVNYVLTAAHCVEGVKLAEVILGAHYIKENETTQVRMNSTSFTIHKWWCSMLIINDIALVKLPMPATINENIRTIKLVPASENDNKFVNKFVTVSGWGLDSDKSRGISKVLRYTNSTIIRNFDCSLSYFPYLFLLRRSNICASGVEGKSSCNGDSGGPLTAQLNGEPVQIGIVSFGRAAGCEKGFPHVYTRLTSYLKWIEQNSDVKTL